MLMIMSHLSLDFATKSQRYRHSKRTKNGKTDLVEAFPNQSITFFEETSFVGMGNHIFHFLGKQCFHSIFTQNETHSTSGNLFGTTRSNEFQPSILLALHVLGSMIPLTWVCLNHFPYHMQATCHPFYQQKKNHK